MKAVQSMTGAKANVGAAPTSRGAGHLPTHGAGAPGPTDASAVPAGLRAILTAENRCNVENWIKGLLDRIRPLAVTLDPTYACPFRCWFCIEDPAMSMVTCGKEISIFMLRKLAYELWALGTRFIALFGGEPLAHSRVCELVTLLAETGFRIGVATNGYLLRARIADALACARSNIAWVRVSVNAGTAETHTLFHRPPKECFETILSQARDLAARGVNVGFSYVVCELNASEIAACARLCRDAGGTSLQVKPRVDAHTRMAVQLPPQIARVVKAQVEEARDVGGDSFSVYVVPTLEYALDGGPSHACEHEAKSYGFCPVSLFRMVISPPGRVVSCPYFRGSERHTIGSLDETLDSAWLQRRLELLRRIDPRLECRFPCNRHPFNEALSEWRARYEGGEDILAHLPVVEHSDPYWL